MSDNVPFELQMEIVQRIPDTKSVIQFRSVSKAWKSVIDSKDFVNAHTLLHHQANRHHLLIRELNHVDEQVKYVSIVDDDTFPHRKVSVFVPDLVKKYFISYSEIIGASHGLFCLYNWKREPRTAVIWNPCIRKTVAIAVPKVFSNRHLSTVFGFGVCPRNLDPKLVKITIITYLGYFSKLQDENTSTQVEVFTLSSGGTWRSPLNHDVNASNVLHNLIEFGSSQAVIEGFIYWNAVEWMNVDDDDDYDFRNLIISFDLTSEAFTKINLPDSLAFDYHAQLSVSNIRESLVVLDSECTRKFMDDFFIEIYHVWMMIGDGCTRSFNKLYSINAPDELTGPLGFRRSGTPIIEVKNDTDAEYNYESALATYEPESKILTHIGIHGLLDSTFSVHSYKETLLLLGH